ncbi:hypothetical protein ILYODFUR_014477 [Ilyodon furcidens]|uniref:Uncharacterized protein n=1 Tax=Ilyodon furcidens TaxID=33524 RepID=A0ABV0SMU8_9TELE
MKTKGHNRWIREKVMEFSQEAHGSSGGAAEIHNSGGGISSEDKKKTIEEQGQISVCETKLIETLKRLLKKVCDKLNCSGGPRLSHLSVMSDNAAHCIYAY